MKRILLPACMLAAMLANATGNFSLIEINPRQGSEEYYWSDSSKRVYGCGELSNITILNDKLYFTAQGSEGNEELWTSDGTTAGTTLVKDINPDGSSMMGNVITMGNRMLFMAADNNDYNFDLWASDGTAAGTYKVADIDQGWNDALTDQRAARFGNKLLFCTSNSLLSTDGTPTGTDTLLSIQQYNPAQGYCELNGVAYFVLTNAQGRPELWITNGTAQGTQMAVNLSNTSEAVFYVTQMQAFNGKIYIIGSANGQGSELYTYSGGVNGQLTKVVLTNTGNAYPEGLTVYNNQLFFKASNETSNNIYRMTTADAVPQIIPTPSVSYINSGITFANGNAYFMSDVQNRINWVKLSDLSFHTLDLTAYTLPNYWFSTNSILTGDGGKIFFAAYDTATQRQVFIESDGTIEGTIATMPAGANTQHAFNILISCGSADIFDFKMWGDKVIVPANFNNAGRELWFYEPQKTTTGIAETPKKLEVSVFPNPATTQLNFTIGGNGYCDNDVTITSLDGKVVLQQKAAAGISSLDISGLAAGNYCITFTSTGKAAAVKQFSVVK
ncbi:MAG: hypothetical protein RLZZ367_2531 [Bacteroidota bacterium]